MPRPRVSLLIPTLNEIHGMHAIMPRIDRSWVDEIVVVDGGSVDGTVEYCRDHGIPCYPQPGRGMPLAYCRGLEIATGDIIVTFTPDGNSLPELVPVLRDTILQGYDMVVASRYLPGARSEDDDWKTALGNRCFTALVNLLFGASHTDVLVGLRAYRREAIVRMRLAEHEREGWLRARWFYMNGWELGSCIRAPRLGLRTTEIPGDEPPRIGGVRKLSIVRNGLGSLTQILWDFCFFSPRASTRGGADV